MERKKICLYKASIKHSTSLQKVIGYESHKCPANTRVNNMLREFLGQPAQQGPLKPEGLGMLEFQPGQ